MFFEKEEVGVLAADLVLYGAVRGRGLHLVGHVTRRKDTALFHKTIVYHNVNALEIERGLRFLNTLSVNVLLLGTLSSFLDFQPDLASVFTASRLSSIGVCWYLSLLLL